MQFKHIALIGKYQSENLASHIATLGFHLQQHGFKIFIDYNESNNQMQYPNFNYGDIDELISIVDVAVVLGGDGTLLAAARKLVDHNIPVIGINQGRLGFMTDISIDRMLQVIDDMLINNVYTTETRNLISATLIRNNKNVISTMALNDVVISRGAIGSMIEFEISINDNFVLSQKSDGVIFATPTGSTAYSLAAGGPIMHPESAVFSIVPICPQSLSNRPLVVHDDVTIEFNLTKDNPAQIHFDGQQCFDLRLNDKVTLCKYPKQFKLIHPLEYNYYHTLRTKLDWSKRVS